MVFLCYLEVSILIFDVLGFRWFFKLAWFRATFRVWGFLGLFLGFCKSVVILGLGFFELFLGFGEFKPIFRVWGILELIFGFGDFRAISRVWVSSGLFLGFGKFKVAFRVRVFLGCF
jgi:hypothetical protein